MGIGKYRRTARNSSFIFQVVRPKGRVSVDWAYRYMGMFSTPSVSIYRNGSKDWVSVDSGKTLVVEPNGDTSVE